MRVEESVLELQTVLADVFAQEAALPGFRREPLSLGARNFVTGEQRLGYRTYRVSAGKLHVKLDELGRETFDTAEVHGDSENAGVLAKYLEHDGPILILWALCHRTSRAQNVDLTAQQQLRGMLTADDRARAFRRVSARAVEVLDRRFLGPTAPETLLQIGKDFGIPGERVRQMGDHAYVEATLNIGEPTVHPEAADFSRSGQSSVPSFGL